ncbi:hypothetical protein KFE25_011164 [Diacronema lutheri]|uniref:HTTM domain-containing protein n=1 Tax=Diacronema lutheri TaxID=2081491 RepID=A0A8J5XFY7_DIALT|nr:hypothetical protein KFE25_011164 [Diacronema lutheri]
MAIFSLSTSRLRLRTPRKGRIYDRYAHFFLLLAAALPCGAEWSVDRTRRRGARVLLDGEIDGEKHDPAAVPAAAAAAPSAECSAAVMLLRAQLLWIYADAGWGKALDPDGAWLLSARVPALETMLLHTRAGRALRSALAPVDGVRFLTASVVWAEVALPPLALLCALANRERAQAVCAALVVAMHVGIGVCMNNAALLSFVAAIAWVSFIPTVVWDGIGGLGRRARARGARDRARAAATPPKAAEARARADASAEPRTRHGGAVAVAAARGRAGAFLLPLACVIASFNWRQSECDVRDDPAAPGAGASRVASALLHNRWNVFTSGEDHVTWYLAPARLADGSIVDLWARGAPVSWAVPAVAPRSGRWKSFAAVAFAAPSAPRAAAAAAAGSGLPAWLAHRAAAPAAPAVPAPVAQGSVTLWRFLCAEWDERHARGAPERRVLAFKFFLLSADIVLDAPARSGTAAGDGEPNGTASASASGAAERGAGGVAFGPPRKRLLAAYECGS